MQKLARHLSKQKKGSVSCSGDAWLPLPRAGSPRNLLLEGTGVRARCSGRGLEQSSDVTGVQSLPAHPSSAVGVVTSWNPETGWVITRGAVHRGWVLTAAAGAERAIWAPGGGSFPS